MHMMTSSHVNSMQKVARTLGFVFTAIGAIMTFTVGMGLGGDHWFLAGLSGVGMAAVSIGVAVLLFFVEWAWRTGMRSLATGLMVAFAVGATIEFAAHVAFFAGHRSSNVEHASLQNARHADTRDTVEDIAKRLNILRAKYDWQKSYDPPSAYDARIETLARKVELEASRKGCKDKCLALKAEHASLVAERAIAADRLTTAEEIKAAEGELIAARKKAGTTAKGESAVLSQTEMIAAVVTRTLKPSEDAKQWTNYGVGGGMGLVYTFAGAIFFLVGFREWSIKSDLPDPEPSLKDRKPYPRNPATGRTMIAADTPDPSVLVLKDQTLKEWAERVLGTPQMLKAA